MIGNPDLFWTAMLFDNSSSGGIRTGVDLNSGTIRTGSEDIHLGGRVFTIHPDTGVEFVGVKIPFFHESLEVAEKAATHLGHPLVGWDIAIGLKGPVLIDGNRRPNHHGSEIASGPYIRNSVLGAFIQELAGKRGL
jgi:hypothetical protein